MKALVCCDSQKMNNTPDARSCSNEYRGYFVSVQNAAAA